MSTRGPTEQDKFGAEEVEEEEEGRGTEGARDEIRSKVLVVHSSLRKAVSSFSAAILFKRK